MLANKVGLTGCARMPNTLFSTAAVAAVFLVSMLHSAASLPLNDIIGEAAAQARREHGLVKRATSDCAQPTNLDQMFRDLNSQVNATQFLRPASLSKVVTADDITPNNVRWVTDPNINKTCPSSVTRVSTAPLEHRTLCPFYFDILQLPEGYYPPTFNFARCKCQECVEKSTMSCEPVMTSFTILRAKGCKQGLQLYQEERIQIATSCTCAYKGTIVNPLVTTTPINVLPPGEV